MPHWSLWILFGLFSFTTQVLAHYYVWRRLVRDTGIGHPWRKRLTVAIIVLGLSIPLTLWTTRIIGADIGRTLGWPVLLWLGFAALMLIGFLLIDGARIAAWSLRVSWARMRGKPLRRFDPARRQFFARVVGTTVVTAATGAAAVGMREVLGDHEVKEVPITLARLPRSLDGFVIAQITDVHVGFTVARPFVQSIVDRVNEIQPDLVAITGDLVDGDLASLRDAVQPLAGFSAPRGVYFVTGNHEYYSGVDEWLGELERLGIRVLRNERVTIGTDDEAFDLAGIDDHDAHRFGNGHGPDLARALAGRDPSRELVLLAHQPRQVHQAKKHHVGLQLSGHTHGGQIWPWHYIVQIQQGGLLAGLSRHAATQLYISRGAGYWGPPMRVGAPAEITKIVLRSEQQA